jgi:hypothetical protein
MNYEKMWNMLKETTIELSKTSTVANNLLKVMDSFENTEKLLEEIVVWSENYHRKEGKNEN